jgi:hypothetical protein
MLKQAKDYPVLMAENLIEVCLSATLTMTAIAFPGLRLFVGISYGLIVVAIVMTFFLDDHLIERYKLTPEFFIASMIARVVSLIFGAVVGAL